MDCTPDLFANDIIRVAADDLHWLNFGPDFASAAVRFTSVVDGRVRDYKADSEGVVNAYNLPAPMTYRVEVGRETIPYFYVTTRYLCGLETILNHGKNKNTEPKRFGATEEDAWLQRAAATELIEHEAMRHFTPYIEQEARCTVAGCQYFLRWPDAELVGEAATESFCKASDSFVIAKTTGPVTFCYRAGLEHAPHAIRRAAVVLAASYLTPSRVPDRATGESADNHYVRFSIEGRDGPTGIPAVDAAIEQCGRKRLRVF